VDDTKGRRYSLTREATGDDNSGESIRSLLFRGSKISPIQNVTLRIGIAVLALVITALIVYFERTCYADRGVTGELTLVDAFYYATVSLSTTGYGDIVPVCESSRIVNVLVITPLRFLFLIVLIGTTIEVLTKKLEVKSAPGNGGRKWKTTPSSLDTGSKVAVLAKALLDAGYNANSIVVVSPDRESCDLATRDGLVAFVGDGRQEEVLKDVSIERAGQIIVATNEDDTSVLVTLTARRLAPATAKIIAAVRESQNADVMRQSGANSVIPTAESAGRLMGLSVISSEAGALMEDLLDSSRGLEVTERAVTKEELSMSPGELNEKGQIVLAVIRNGITHRFYTESIRFLEQGDRMVVIKYNREED